MLWLLLITSLPTENATARMRAWRALKASGAAVLRDGVYLLPDEPAHAATLTAVAEDLRSNSGTAHLLRSNSDDPALPPLFDRSPAYGALLADITRCRAQLREDTVMGTSGQARKLRRQFDQLAAIDFFPGPAQQQAQAAMQALEVETQALLSPGEPSARDQALPRLDVAGFQGRTWATRRRPRADRLASAWLIRRFIDPQARFLWLKSPADCPRRAVGFDFDGATFTHVGARVTFETLLASFGLETPALVRLGLLVHSLDAGGVQPPEAAGVQQVLAGMCEAITDDDQLLQVTAGVFEGLLTAFNQEASA